MRKIGFLLALFASIGLTAQITINNTHMPQSGDTLRYSVATLDTAVLLNFQASGANLTWNFDSLQALRQGLSEFYSSAQTPYSSAITGRIGEKIADTLTLGAISLYDVYDFYNSSTSDFSIDYKGASAPTGLSFPFPPTLSITQIYSDKDEVYQFPLSYLDRDSSTYNFLYTNPLIGAYYSSSGYRINEVDAWGSLTTPYGTFNCIRVVTDIVGYDSVSFGGQSFGINNHTREYKWLSTQFEIPALTVNGLVVANVFVPTTVEYRDSVRNVPSLFAPIALFTADETNPMVGDTVNFNNLSISLTNANYQWSISRNTFNYLSGTSSTTDTIVVAFTDTGFYNVQLIATNARGADTLFLQDYIYVDPLSTGIDGSDKKRAAIINAFPNPIQANSELFLGPFEDEGRKAVELFDNKGSLILSREIKNSGPYFTINSPSISGVYYLKVSSEEGLSTQKIVVAE